MSSTVDEAVAALRAGGVAIVPTDTVYGLAADPESADAVRELSRLKRRDETPADRARRRRPRRARRARSRSCGAARPRSPARFCRARTRSCLPNPARTLRLARRVAAETIGIRVPELAGVPRRELLEQVGALAATSANLTGEADPRTLDEVPAELRSAAAALLDAGPLPGTPSTVLDFTGAEPVHPARGSSLGRRGAPDRRVSALASVATSSKEPRKGTQHGHRPALARAASHRRSRRDRPRDRRRCSGASSTGSATRSS